MIDLSQKKRNHWHVEAARDWESDRREWAIVDDHGGIWGSFYTRAAATACVKGFRTIGFVPRPKESDG